MNGIGMGPRQENGGEGSIVKRALKTVEALQARLAEVENARREPIAIIGMGCRFPGGAVDADSYWQLLRDGVDAIREVPRGRWDIGRYFDADAGAPGKMHTRSGGFVDGLDYFDAAFFQISPREARSLDPQHRLLLEVSWEALENAGIAPLSLRGKPLGVFAGLCSNDYAQLLAQRPESEIDAYLATGTAHSMATGRLSYIFGSTGPNLAVDTACSSSLAAVHLAIRSLRSGESEIALAGGANCILTPAWSINFCKANMLAPDGRCKMFDAAADGFVRGEGAGMVVLKRLSHALRDGDRVLAMLRASAMNQDGHTSGPTVPSGPAQQAVILRALGDAGISPGEVSYVEAHGTGTSLGDPIEAAALAEVFGTSHSSERPLFAGSAKTNIGHLEGAAGIAGLIKTVLALHHRTIPGNLHFHKLSPHIGEAGTTIEVPSRTQAWRSEGPRTAGVSSFGFSGTNVHVVVQEAPALPHPEPARDAVDRDWHLLTVSAKTDAALRESARRIATHASDDLRDVAFTANGGRSHFGHRLAIVARDWKEAAAGIGRFLETGAAEGVLAGAAGEGTEPSVVFAFAGTAGDLRAADLKNNDLYRTQAAFRAVVDDCAESPCGSRAAVLFTLQVALAETWRSWGIHPAAVHGTGAGRYAALHVAGVYGRQDAQRLADSGGEAAGTVARGARVPVLASTEHSSGIDLEIGVCLPGWKALASQLQSLYVCGADVDWAAWDRGFSRQRVALPTYPFQRRRHWYREEEPEARETAGQAGFGEAGFEQDAFVYEVPWRRLAQGTLPHPAEVLAGLRSNDADAPPVNGLLPAIESLSAAYAAAALEQIGRESSRVPPNRCRLFGRLTEMNGVAGPPGATELQLAALMGRYPEARAELQLVGRCGSNLAAVLTGQCSSVETLFPLGEAGPDKIYRDSASSRAANLFAREAIGKVLAQWPAERPLRLLEAGAGTGGTTAHLLETIRSGSVEYVFTDVSRAFFVKARERFAAADFVRYQVLDVEKAPEAQGFAPGSQDVIVAANVLHATADLRVSLSNLKNLLAPGGLLLLVEVVQPQCWLDVTFGLLDGWWRFRDTGLRVSHPLLRAIEWEALLNESGFEGAASVQTGGASSLLRQGLIVARASAPRTIMLSAASALPDEAPERIVWLRSPDPVAAADACSELLDLVHRVKASGGCRHPRIWAALRDPNGIPDAALRGFGRVAGLECPEIWRGILHVPADAANDEVCRLAAVAEGQAGEREILFRNGEILAPRIVRTPLPARAAPYRFREEGTYLITGGLGFMGLKLANWMAAHGARNLVLMGRSGASNAESKAVMEELRAAGVRVEAVAGDASRAPEIRRVLDTASHMPALRGVVHMAARGHSQPLRSIARRDLEEEFGPKIGGAWALHEETRAMPLDFFVLCSSASSVWGAKGQAHYAAANSCLDLLAGQRRRMGLKALSVNWGLLSGGGMVSAEYRDWLVRAGVQPLEAEDGFDALFRLIDGPAAQVLIARVNWRQFSEVYGAREHSRLFDEIAASQRDAREEVRTEAPVFRQMAPAERRSALSDFVMDQFCRTLGLPAGEAPGPRRGFFDAGMDSLLAIEFRDRLQKSTGVALAATAAFNYPNVEAMAQYLDSLFDAPLAPVSRPAARAPVLQPGVLAEDSDLAGDSDIEATIANMLQGVHAFLREDAS